MERQYVGIDLHRRRSVIVRMDARGEVLGLERIDNDPVALSLALAKAGPDPEVVLEATYGAGTGPWTSWKRRAPRCTSPTPSG